MFYLVFQIIKFQEPDTKDKLLTFSWSFSKHSSCILNKLMDKSKKVKNKKVKLVVDRNELLLFVN